MDRETEGVIVVELDLDEIRDKRRSWGIYRDLDQKCMGF